MSEQLITALYERLSRDDDNAGDSNSIVNQKSYLQAYAEQNGFTNCQHYTDDGWSGGNFDRPGWKQMIADIEAGKVGTVLAKDMSRIGRNYLQTGFYTEVHFRRYHVRFIAIANSVDNSNPTSNEFTPFLNIMNEWYLRDQSKKVISAYRQKGKRGLPTNNNCIFGYRKDPEDKNHWLIDEEAAAVVRHIYELAIDGHGPYNIARILAKEQIYCPAYYNAVQGNSMKRASTDMSKPYAWSGATVSNILDHQEYMGHTVNFRSTKASYKEKRQHNPQDEWLIIKDTHDAIITSDVWELAQITRRCKRRTDTTGEANPLTGLLYCAECGAKLYNHRSKSKDGLPSSDIYDCPTYTQRKGDETCCSHHIATATVRSILQEAIRSVGKYAIENEAEFAAKVREASALRQANEAKALSAKVRHAKKRINDLDVMIQKLYESYALGKTPEKRFDMLSAAYEQEQQALRDLLSQDENDLNAYEADSDSIERFVCIAKKHRDADTLTTPMINEFVEKIVVHAPTKVDGERRLIVDIYFRFIGNFTVPVEKEDPSPSELAEAERKRKERERNRRKYQQRKQRKIAETA